MSSIKVRQRTYPSGRTSWQVDLHFLDVDGQPRRKQLQAPPHVTSRTAAQRWGTDQLARLATGEAPRTARSAPPQPPPTPVVSVATAGEWWAQAAEAARMSPATIDHRRRLVRDYLAPALLDRHIGDLTLADVQRVSLSLRDASVSFLEVVLRALRGACKAARDRGVDVPLVVPLPRVPPADRPRAYDAPAFERIVDAARESGPQYLALVLLCGEAGLRRGEVLGLQVVDALIGAESGVLRVARARVFGAGAYHTKTPKSRRARLVPLSSRTRDALRALAETRLGAGQGDGWLVLCEDGSPGTYSVVRSAVATVQRRAGLPEHGPHVLRHTCLTHLVAGGTDTRTVQAIAGHTSLVTTQRYLHVLPEQVAAAAGQLEAFRARASGAASVTSALLVPGVTRRGRVKRSDPG